MPPGSHAPPSPPASPIAFSGVRIYANITGGSIADKFLIGDHFSGRDTVAVGAAAGGQLRGVVMALDTDPVNFNGALKQNLLTLARA